MERLPPLDGTPTGSMATWAQLVEDGAIENITEREIRLNDMVWTPLTTSGGYAFEVKIGDATYAVPLAPMLRLIQDEDLGSVTVKNIVTKGKTLVCDGNGLLFGNTDKLVFNNGNVEELDLTAYITDNTYNGFKVSAAGAAVLAPYITEDGSTGHWKVKGATISTTLKLA